MPLDAPVITTTLSLKSILKNKIFPLPEILKLLLALGNRGMGCPVEIEFAVNMSVPEGQPKELGPGWLNRTIFIQLRLKNQKMALSLLL